MTAWRSVSVAARERQTILMKIERVCSPNVCADESLGFVVKCKQLLTRGSVFLLDCGA